MKATYGGFQLFTYKNSSKLYIQFRYESKQQRISTKLEDTAKNRKYCEALIVQMEIDRLAGIFDPSLEKYLGFSRNKPKPEPNTGATTENKPKSKSKPYKTTRKQHRLPITTDQFQSLIQAIRECRFDSPYNSYPSSHYANFIEMSYLLGLRNQELIGLQVKHCNFEQNTIEISSVLARAKNCSNAKARIRKQTKTGNIRYLPMSDRVREILALHCRGKSKEDLVFTSYRGLSIDDRALQRRVIKPYLKALGIEDRDLYAMRHSFGSRAIEQGFNLSAVSYLMGHSSVETTIGQGSKKLGINTDSIFFYCKSQGKNLFNFPFVGYKEDYIKKFYKYVEPDGRRYRLISMIAPGGAAKGNPEYEVMGVTRYWRYSKKKMQELIDSGLVVQTNPGTVPVKKQYLDDGKGNAVQSLWDDIEALSPSAKERLGYPTQKPEALLERIIEMSSNEGDVVLDAYCGCGTTVSVAQKLNREWIGIDITYQSISLILRRLEDNFGSQILDQIQISGIPRDIKSAEALATKKDDRTRKEFEKWAVLSYSNNRAIINQKKGADQGIDGTAFFLKSEGGHGRIIFQVKSGKVGSGDIRDLHGTMSRENAELGIFITLKEPSSAMTTEARRCGLYRHEVMGRDYPCIQIITVKDIIEGKKRLDVPLSMEVLKTAERKSSDRQLDLLNGSTDEATEAQATA